MSIKLPLPENLRANTIEEVIHSLDKIIQWTKQHKSRMGYFPALYRKVTRRVRNGIIKGEFQDGPRMERLDVIFANRYLDAFEKYHAGQNTSAAWKYSFDACRRWHPIALQHLLLGMNAHIALDLGIAAAEAVGPEDLADLKKDFFIINDLLISMINDVQLELAQIWPLLRILDVLSGPLDESAAKFGMKLARGKAWKVAEEIARLDPQARDKRIAELDADVAKFARRIRAPRFGIRYALYLVRISEFRSIKSIIKILE